MRKRQGGEMTKRFLLAVLLGVAGIALVPLDAPAKGIGASVQGATVRGLPYRYVAIAPNSPQGMRSGGKAARFTVVARIDKQGGRVGRWWYLPGPYSIPAAAYDDRAGGLSTDGGTLVLSRFSWIYPPRTTGLAILDTSLYLRHPGGRERRPRGAIRKVHLDGSFSYDAISPDGSTIYLIEHLKPYYGGPYQVRALEAKSGKLLPKPIVDPSEPWERMEGTPISRVTSPDGRWAYTLYSDHQRGRYDLAHEPFIHALDTVAGEAVCIDLPQLEGQPTSFKLALRVNSDEGQLEVLNRRPGPKGSRALLTVDTASFEVHQPPPVATTSSGFGPWPPIVALSALTAALLAWAAMRRRREARGDGLADRG
jgi:hypothetical protein